MFKISLRNFSKKYGNAIGNAFREGKYGFNMTIPKKLKNDPMGKRAIENAFKMGRQEYKNTRIKYKNRK